MGGMPEVMGFCPKCNAENLLPNPRERSNPSQNHPPMAVSFECFKCKQHVQMLVADLEENSLT